MERIVLDTNCLLISLASKSVYHRVWTDFIGRKYILCVTNDIITEYEEILTQKVGKDIAGNIIRTILSRDNTVKIDICYRFNMITADADDNKFVDCAVAANARFVVTQDRHFDVLKQIKFPHVDVTDIDSFILWLNHNRN